MSMLTRWTGNRDFTALSDFRRQMDHLFDEMFSLAPADFERDLMLKTTTKDDGEKVVVRAEIPGFSDKDVKVALLDGMLTISGERKVDAKEKKDGERHEEYQFTRSMTIPGKVDPEKCMAEMKNGVLTVTLTRTPESRARQIAIKGS